VRVQAAEEAEQAAGADIPGEDSRKDTQEVVDMAGMDTASKRDGRGAVGGVGACADGVAAAEVAGVGASGGSEGDERAARSALEAQTGQHWTLRLWSPICFATGPKRRRRHQTPRTRP